MMRPRWTTPIAWALLAIGSTMLMLTTRRPALCQNHFKPIMHPYPMPSRMIYHHQQQHKVQPSFRPPSGGSSLMAALSGRASQNYLNQMAQQQTKHSHMKFALTVPTNPLSGASWHNAPISDRRASSSMNLAPNQLLPTATTMTTTSTKHQVVPTQTQGDHQQVPFQQAAKANSQDEQNTKQQQLLPDRNGKLLICYYTTKQTAPYWPKDAREFVVPTERLQQVVASFASESATPQFQVGQNFKSANLPHTRFSSPINQQQQQHYGGSSASTQSNFVQQPSTGVQEARTINVAHTSGENRNGQNPFTAAGGRMIVVAPKFVPFNQSTSRATTATAAVSTNQGRAFNRMTPALAMLAAKSSPQEPQPASSSFAQMFFMPNNNEQRHNTIANRQDNAASITTSGTINSLGATNQPGTRQSITPNQRGELTVSNGSSDNLGDGIVFDKIPRAKSDPNNLQRGEGGGRNFNGGGLLTIVDEETSAVEANLAQPSVSTSVQFSVSNSKNNNGPATARQAHTSGSNVNNRDQQQLQQQQLERSAQTKQQQQVIYSPSMSRTFIVGASAGLPLIAGGGNTDNQDQLLAQSVPLVNADNSHYYYYYNQPSGSSISTPAGHLRTAAGSGTIGPAAASTISLATSTSHQPIQQQQQQHDPSGTTMTTSLNFVGGSGGMMQKGKSLQVTEPAEMSLGPNTATTSSLSPITFVQSASGVPPSYSISGMPSSHQGQTLDRLIVSNGPPSVSVATSVRQQQYSSPSSLSSPNQATGFTPNDLFKPTSSAGGDDGLISSGTRTTPIASSAPSSSSPPMASSQQQQHQQHKLLATLPSGLLSPSSPTSIATARPPNSSSTASTAASSMSSTQMDGASLGGGDGNPMLNSASTVSESAINSGGAGNRHHHQHNNNNRQIVGVGGNSLSAALVSSPLSTMFDVFGAASQYLMRFRPSSLISPSSFASLNSITGDSSGAHHHQHSRLNSSGSSSSLVSLPFASGLLASTLHHSQKSNISSGGFLSRLSLQNHQRREDVCGRTIQTPERRIIGGEGARYGEFPYQVHIKIAKHQCGGALIDKQSIVTAAHCVYHFITRAPVSKLQIVIGAYDIEDEQYQELPPQYFKVNRVKLHPNFRFSASHPDRYDIAILKLDKPVKYTDNVLPVCLPGKDLKYENMIGTVTGFGKTDPSLSNRYGTRLLQKVDVPIIENGECERWHRTRGIDLKIFPEMMCAGYEDGLKDACVGDSGGPLVVKTPVGSNGSFRWTLAGITSAGFGCAQSRQPGIYHRVSHTVDWILDNLD